MPEPEKPIEKSTLQKLKEAAKNAAKSLAANKGDPAIEAITRLSHYGTNPVVAGYEALFDASGQARRMIDEAKARAASGNGPQSQSSLRSGQVPSDSAKQTIYNPDGSARSPVKVMIEQKVASMNLPKSEKAAQAMQAIEALKRRLGDDKQLQADQYQKDANNQATVSTDLAGLRGRLAYDQSAYGGLRPGEAPPNTTLLPPRPPPVSPEPAKTFEPAYGPEVYAPPPVEEPPRRASYNSSRETTYRKRQSSDSAKP